ncbi:hypothetical protein BT69DRAFT_929619 [Atractiella rhizophila]|nr:hypothetical protein BT69DRAFT_929619 [Atractiella rhizophila]
MIFCPNCSNLLTVSKESGSNKFVCDCCPYEYQIEKQYTHRTYLKRKEVDDVMGGEDAWKNVDTTIATCPKCEADRAFYMQIQIRSADEPMTTFFRCTNTKCAFQWKEN